MKNVKNKKHINNLIYKFYENVNANMKKLFPTDT